MGDADLSADVDFQSLMHYLGPESKIHYLYTSFIQFLDKYSYMTQGEFLESMGIRKRAEMLASKIEDVDKAVERLVSNDQMGKIYKVLQFSRK